MQEGVFTSSVFSIWVEYNDLGTGGYFGVSHCSCRSMKLSREYILGLQEYVLFVNSTKPCMENLLPLFTDIVYQIHIIIAL